MTRMPSKTRKRITPNVLGKKGSNRVISKQTTEQLRNRERKVTKLITEHKQ